MTKDIILKEFGRERTQWQRWDQDVDKEVETKGRNSLVFGITAFLGGSLGLGGTCLWICSFSPGARCSNSWKRKWSHLLLSIVTVLLLLLWVKIGSKETFKDQPRQGASNISIVAAFEIYAQFFLSIVSNVLAVANVIFFALALCHILRAGLRPLDLVSSSPRLQSIRPTMPCDPWHTVSWLNSSVTFLVSKAPLNRTVKNGCFWVDWTFRIAAQNSGGH